MSEMSEIASPEQDGEHHHDVAPRLIVPSERIVTVEHPCIVKNVDKASDMLGGSKAIADILEHNTTKTMGLKFTPSGKDIVSLNNRTDNVLLRITVPRVIGKRKRGSGDPFQPVTQEDMHQGASSILRSIQDNPETAIISPLGTIESTHVFRSIPDLVYSTPTSFFKHDIKSKLFSQDYDTIRQFQLPCTYGAREDEVLPPPVLSSVSLPQYYSYVDKQTTKPLSTTARIEDKESLTGINDHDPNWPTTIQANLPPLTAQSKRVQSLVEQLQTKFETRPLWTRRALINTLPPEAHITLLRRALSYIAFYIRSGPWRDTLCRLGVDPRKDPSCSQYQNVHIRLSRLTGRALGWFRSKNPRDHLYTGTEGAQQYGNRLFQLCDITDPLLTPLIANSSRSECDPIHFGWYQNGTFSKITTLLRAKLEASITHISLEGMEQILALPDHFESFGDTHPATSGNPGYLPDSSSEEVKELAAEYRQTIRNAENKRAKRMEAVRDDTTGLLKGPGPVDDEESASPEPDLVTNAPRPAFESAWDMAG